MKDKINRRKLLTLTSMASITGIFGVASAEVGSNPPSKSNNENKGPSIDHDLKITNHTSTKKEISIDIHRGNNSSGKTVFSKTLVIESGVNPENRSTGKEYINDVQLRGGKYWVVASTKTGKEASKTINLSKSGGREMEEISVRITPKAFRVGINQI